jgi:hypothetical protein
LRGTGKDVLAIFADEFLFFNPAVLPALLPTLATGAIFVMTSSVSPDGDSPLVKLLDTKYNDGTNVVRKLNWTEACKTCERKGIADRCTHITRPPQHFQSFGGQERMNRLMSQNAESFDREILNIGGKPGITAAFESQWLDAIVAQEYDLRKPINHFFITVDPSAAKDRNLYVIMSMIFVDGQCVMLGAECMNTCHSLTVAQLVVEHIRQCRRLKHLTYAMPIVIPESNLPYIAQQLQIDVKRMYNDKIVFMMEDSGSKMVDKDLPGSMTTHRKKNTMVTLLQNEYLKPGRLSFHRSFVNVKFEELPFDDIKIEIMKELRGFRQKRCYKLDAEGQSICQLIFTGKAPIGQNDDFVMVLLMGCYNEKLFFEDARYSMYW